MQEFFYGCEKILCVPRGHTKRKKDDAGTAGREDRGYRETVIEREMKMCYHEQKNRF